MAFAWRLGSSFYRVPLKKDVSVVASGKDATLGLNPSPTAYPCNPGKPFNLLVPQFPHLLSSLIAAASSSWNCVKVYRVKGVVRARATIVILICYFRGGLGPLSWHCK